MSKFTPKIQEYKLTLKVDKFKNKLAEIIKLPPSILSKPSKEILEKSKFFEKIYKTVEKAKPNNKLSYAQVSSPKVSKILKIKENFPNLSMKKIKDINKIINIPSKPKPRINIMIKGLSRKQIIVGNNNKTKFTASSSEHIANLNRVFKNIKSDVMANFTCMDQISVVIVTKKVASSLNLQIVENYIKNVEHINSEDVETPHLPQSKSYLKIINISYLMENTNTSLNSSVIETILKNNHIFNNVVIVLKSCIIKMSSKSDMAIVWLNIWDVQNNSKAKELINRYFNIRSYIAIIQGTNMNPDILQYKNCWKWEHITFSC